MSDKLTITFAGRTFEIPPLTIRQVRDVDEAIRANSNGYDSAVNVIAIGLRIAAPDMTAEKVFDLPATAVEITKTMQAIVTFARGEEEKPASGEAPAAAA